jgi:hypothetical protein
LSNGFERSINLSVGVVDRGVGAGFGTNPHSNDSGIENKAQVFINTVKESL